MQFMFWNGIHGLEAEKKLYTNQNPMSTICKKSDCPTSKKKKKWKQFKAYNFKISKWHPLLGTWEKIVKDIDKTWGSDSTTSKQKRSRSISKHIFKYQGYQLTIWCGDLGKLHYTTNLSTTMLLNQSDLIKM